MDDGVPLFIFWDSVAFWNFINTQTEWCWGLTFVFTLQSTICNGFCVYFIQSLTLVKVWTLFIIGSLASFSRILWDIEILLIHWLIGVWNPPMLLIYSPKYVMDHVHICKVFVRVSLSKSMNPIDYGISGYFLGFCGTLKFCEYRLGGV